MTSRLFVYGTLRRGVRNKLASILSQCAHYAGPGKVRGRLYRVSHYPGLVLSDDSEGFAHGDVYSMDHPVALMKILDSYERQTGPQEFKRTIATVELHSGEQVGALLYVYTRGTAGRRRIMSGDYLNPRRGRRR